MARFGASLSFFARFDTALVLRFDVVLDEDLVLEADDGQQSRGTGRGGGGSSSSREGV